jgi:hypothetical protein
MLRIAEEVRIFPLVDLNCQKSNLFKEVVYFFVKENYDLKVEPVDYEFQKNANEMLCINRKEAKSI